MLKKANNWHLIPSPGLTQKIKSLPRGSCLKRWTGRQGRTMYKQWWAPFWVGDISIPLLCGTNPRWISSSCWTLAAPGIEKNTVWAWALLESCYGFDHAACGWLCNIGKQGIENKNQVWEMVPVFCQKASQCLSPVCQHFQELKSGLFAIIYKQETNTQLRIRCIRFIDRGTVGLLHSYREFHKDIPRSSCPQERHGNCQYGLSHFIPPIKNPWVLPSRDMRMAHGHCSHSSSVAVNFQDGGSQISLLHLWSPLGSWKLPVKGHDMSDMVVTGSSLSILVT